MANLCKTCSEKTPVTPMRGQCQAMLSSKCTGWTSSFSFTLCDECSEEMKRCAWCWGRLDGNYPTITVPTDKRFCRVFEHENDKHVKRMYIGEQLLVQVTDQGSTRIRLRRLAGGVSFATSRFVPDPHNPRQGWLELYFDLNEATPKAEIELDIYSGYGSPPRTFKCTAEVRH